LSALALLRPHLTEENHAELLQAVHGKAKREVELLLAARFPRQDEPTRMRAISPERFRIEFTASAELREKLERCLDLSSHANPRRDLGFVIERAVDLLLTKLEKERLGKAERPRSQTKVRHRAGAPSNDTPGAETPNTPPPSEGLESRHVPNAVRRLVFERDGDRCAYVSPEGHRCDATAFLELDHVVPHALGGGFEPENLRVRCRAHNRLWAEQTFGRAHVERAVHFRQRKCCGTPKDELRVQPKRATDSLFDAHEKIVVALKQLGFGESQARRAVCAVEKRQCVESRRSLETLLREAVLEATRAA
jgi:hypothetical protein